MRAQRQATILFKMKENTEMKFFSNQDSHKAGEQTARIIFFYEHVSREVDAIMHIVHTLLNRAEIKLEVLVAQINIEWPDAVKYAKRSGIDAIILPSCYAAIPDCLWAMPFRRISSQLVIINFHHEQILTPFNTQAQLPQDEYAKNGCMHIAWADGFKKSLSKTGVKEQLIRVTGNPRADLLLQKNANANKANLAKTYHLDESKKWILFCENRYGSAAAAIDAQTKNAVNRAIDEETFIDKMRLDEEAQNIMYCQMRSLPASFFKKYELIYRPHPGIESEYDLPNTIRVIQDEPIGVWLNAVDMMLVWSSTSAFEADVLGVPVARHEPVPNRAEFQPQGIDFYPCIHDLKDIDDKLISEISLHNKSEKNFEINYGKVDGSSYARISDMILEAISNPPRLKQLPETLHVKKECAVFNARSWISNFLWKRNLLQVLKWPRAGYIHKDEIIK